MREREKSVKIETHSHNIHSHKTHNNVKVLFGEIRIEERHIRPTETQPSVARSVDFPFESVNKPSLAKIVLIKHPVYYPYVVMLG